MNTMISIMKRIVPVTLCAVLTLALTNTSMAFAANEYSTATSTASNNTLVGYNKVVYVKDFGAYGDGLHDDTKAINDAFNSNADAVVFEKDASYKTNDYITMRTAGVTVFGNNATLFTDNEYRSRSNFFEWYFNVIASDITINDLNILAKETILVGYKTQFAIRNASNVNINNCTFTIPSTVLSNASTREVEYSNIDLFTGWRNISITNCTMTIQADTKAGVCIEMRDILSAGCDSATFTNNTCITNSHDEILALFSSASSTMSNIVISDNSFVASRGTLSATRNVGISLGYSAGGFSGINGITFTNNTLDIQSDHVLFLMGNSKNVTISNNTINYTAATSSNPTYLVRAAATDNSVTLSNNNINISNNASGNFAGLATGIVYFNNNTVKSDAAITNALFANNAIANSNNITLNNTTKRLGSCIYEFNNNTVEANGTLVTMFEYYNKTLERKVNISENTISCLSSTPTKDTFIMLNGTKMNGHALSISNNKIDAPNSLSAKTLYYIALADTSTQNIVINNNSFGAYTEKYITKASASLCNITESKLYAMSVN